MNIQQALSAIHSPKSMTSLINGVMSGDFDPIRDQDATGKSLDQARAKLADVVQAQRDCTSDWAFWGYEGDKAYWQAVVNILEAAEITGPNALPDIPAPQPAGVVMDQCAAIDRFGKAVLDAAKNQRDLS